MKVYVTYEKEGWDGLQIDKVFADEATAQDYIIDSILESSGEELRHELEERALNFIEEYEVVGADKLKSKLDETAITTIGE